MGGTWQSREQQCQLLSIRTSAWVQQFQAKHKTLALKPQFLRKLLFALMCCFETGVLCVTLAVLELTP